MDGEKEKRSEDECDTRVDKGKERLLWLQTKSISRFGIDIQVQPVFISKMCFSNALRKSENFSSYSSSNRKLIESRFRDEP